MNRELISNNEKFKSAMATLNDEQRSAVEQIEGPVLVIAGPGTGKTQILAARIGNILLKTDTDAHNILCLTYTDAGTIAMRKRLYEFIGPDAYRVRINTFHAFCNDVIQENLDYFGKLNLEPISELENAELLRDLIDSLPKNSKLKKYTGKIYSDVARMKNLYSVMKKENWSSEFLISRIDAYIKDLPNRDEYKYKVNNSKKNLKKGDVKQVDIDKETERVELLRAAVNEFARYKEKMASMGRYDYDDMIVWVLNAFKNDENILRPYQEKYEYILVDEYQDTSGSQNEILKLLLSYWDNPNIFVVGDDDQSIYRFQGANIENILEYANEYVDSLYKIVLANNYRSTQSILNISKVLIENNKERLTNHLNLNKNLVSMNAVFKNMNSKPIVREYDSVSQETIDVSKDIISKIEQGVQPKDIAVIYRNHTQSADMVDYFMKNNIPINIKRSENILKLNFVKKISNILRYISLERDTPYSGDQLLFEIMHYDFFNIDSMDIAKISIEVSKDNYSYQNSSKNEKVKNSIRKKLYDDARLIKTDLFTESTLNPKHQFSNDIEFWIKESYNLTLQELFEKIIIRAGILKYIMHSEQRSFYMEVLNTLFNFLKEENTKNPEMNISNFVEMLDLMISNEISLNVNKSTYNENGVNFLTAHGSKGLEFDYVYIIACTKKIWDDKKSGGSKQFKFPDNLSTTIAKSSELEESRRLFYVALTRAKHSLNISYAKRDVNGKDIEASQFIAEISISDDLEIKKVELESTEIENFLSSPFIASQTPSISLLDKDYLDSLLQGYTLSVTHLSNYLDCPLKFYFQNLIRVPSGKSPSATFGQAVHWALNKLFRALKDNNNEFKGSDYLVDQFKWYMNRNRDSFTKTDFKLKLEYGDKILPEYYNTHVQTWNKVALTELPVKNIELNGVPIKGNLDKVEFNGNQVIVVDYKTGKYDNAIKKLDKPSDKNPIGGDYWRQAVFYKILIDNDRSNNWEVVNSVFEFIEPVKNEYKKEKVVFEPNDVKILTEQIQDTYQKILNHEFDKGCGKKDCQWCNFVKTNFADQEILIEDSDE